MGFPFSLCSFVFVFPFLLMKVFCGAIRKLGEGTKSLNEDKNFRLILILETKREKEGDQLQAIPTYITKSNLQDQLTIPISLVAPKMTPTAVLHLEAQVLAHGLRFCSPLLKHKASAIIPKWPSAVPILHLPSMTREVATCAVMFFTPQSHFH